MIWSIRRMGESATIHGSSHGSPFVVAARLQLPLRCHDEQVLAAVAGVDQGDATRGPKARLFEGHLGTTVSG